MPRFFFDIHDGEDFTPDREGLDLDSLEAAKDAAKKTLPDIVKDEMPDGDRRDFTWARGRCRLASRQPPSQPPSHYPPPSTTASISASRL